MPKVNSIYLNFYTLVNIRKQVKYSTDVRVEECHGFHTFIDHEIVSSEIDCVTLRIGDQEIDITSRLSKEELEILETIQEDELEPL